MFFILLKAYFGGGQFQQEQIFQVRGFVSGCFVTGPKTPAGCYLPRHD